MEYVDEFYTFAGVYTWQEQNMENIEESGGWFREQHESAGGNPSDLPDFIYDCINDWTKQ